MKYYSTSYHSGKSREYNSENGSLVPLIELPNIGNSTISWDVIEVSFKVIEFTL